MWEEDEEFERDDKKSKIEWSRLNIFHEFTYGGKEKAQRILLKQTLKERLVNTWLAIYGTSSTIPFTHAGRNIGSRYDRHWGLTDFMFLGVTQAAEKFIPKHPGYSPLKLATRFPARALKFILLDIPKAVISAALFIPGAVGAIAAHGIEAIRLKSFVKRAGHIPVPEPKISEESQDEVVELSTSKVLDAIKTFNEQSQHGSAIKAINKFEQDVRIKSAKFEDGSLVLEMRDSGFKDYQKITLNTKDREQNKVIRGWMKADILKLHKSLSEDDAKELEKATRPGAAARAA